MVRMSSQTGPLIGVEEMRNYILDALRYFNTQSDSPVNDSDRKTINNLTRNIQESIYNDHRSSYFIAPNGFIDKRLNENNRNSFLEAIHFLLIEGIIMWGNAFDRDTLTFPHFSITTHGQKVVKEGGEIKPHDPENYIENVKNKIKNLDKITLIYLKESLQCYLRGNYIASSVMLGVASEATLDLLFNWMLEKDNVTNPDLKNKLEKLQNRNELKTKFDLIYNELEKVQKRFDNSIRDNMETHLKGIFHLIRTQRNDSGHPTGKLISRDDMYINLHVFPAYCETVYKILNYLKKSREKLF